MTSYLRCIFTLMIFIAASLPIKAKNNTIRVLGPQSLEDVSQDYFYKLLDSALTIGSPEHFELEIVDASTLTQGRTLHLLANDYIDVFWMGTSVDREQQFHAIKIPLMRGLLGFRVSIVQEAKLATFKALTLEQFKKKSACQGEHWPDTKILSYNKFSVQPVAKYDAMFDMVSKGRCDYFPRAIFEGYGELAIAQQRLHNIAMLDDVILYYPFPIYFFVNKENAELGQMIEKGLEQMIDSGEFSAFMQNHEVTEHAFPLDKWHNKRILALDNPFLSEGTDTSNTRYWINSFKNK